VIVDLRAERPDPDLEATAPLAFVPGVSHRDGRGFLTIAKPRPGVERGDEPLAEPLRIGWLFSWSATRSAERAQAASFRSAGAVLMRPLTSRVPTRIVPQTVEKGRPATYGRPVPAGESGERGLPRLPAPPTSARIAAAVALVGFVVAILGLGLFVLADFGVLVLAVVCFGIGVPAAWAALTRRRFGWMLWVVAAVFLLAALLLVIWAGDWLLWLLAVVVTTLAGGIALRREVAWAVVRRWKPVPPAQHPLLLMNPKSGGGRVERFGLVEEGEEARDRADRARSRRRSAWAGRAGGAGRGGRHRHGWRRRQPGHRRLGSCRPPSWVRVHPGRHPQPPGA